MNGLSADASKKEVSGFMRQLLSEMQGMPDLDLSVPKATPTSMPTSSLSQGGSVDGNNAIALDMDDFQLRAEDFLRMNGIIPAVAQNNPAGADGQSVAGTIDDKLKLALERAKTDSRDGTSLPMKPTDRRDKGSVIV
jgi:hypothetical protein